MLTAIASKKPNASLASHRTGGLLGLLPAFANLQCKLKLGIWCLLLWCGV